MSPQFANIHVISFECGVDTIQKCNVPALNGHTSLVICMLLSQTERESMYARLYGPNSCTHPVHYRKYFRMSHTAHYQRTAAMFSVRSPYAIRITLDRRTPCHILISFPTISPVRTHYLSFQGMFLFERPANGNNGFSTSTLCWQ